MSAGLKCPAAGVGHTESSEIRPRPNFMRTISIVIPAYNEAISLPQTLARLREVLAGQAQRIEYVLVNDGSQDDTLAVVEAFAAEHPHVLVVDLSRNFGKEAALSAGLSVATGDAVIPLDADLQDPPTLIPEMITLWLKGAEVVVARRSERDSDSRLKRWSAAGFYYLINKISEVPIPDNVGDFRLMDRAVVDAINRLPENRRFMKGLFAWAGFRTEVLEYSRPARTEGASKFNLFGLLKLAAEGFTSFSTVPLRIASLLGALIAMVSFIAGIVLIARTLMYGIDVPGYASLAVMLLFFSGMQLLALGLIGEYVGRIYMESKRRPAFVIRRITRGRDLAR